MFAPSCDLHNKDRCPDCAPPPGHHCREGWRPWSRGSCSNKGCFVAQEGVHWTMWCARCELAYEYAFATEVGMPTIWAWLMAHHNRDHAMSHVTPQCPRQLSPKPQI